MIIEQLPLPLGDVLKQQGMALAASTAPAQAWRERAEDAFFDLIRSRSHLTCDDIIEAVGLPHPDGGPNENNAVGHFLPTMAKRGYIRKTDRTVPSRRAKSHSREVRVWAVTGY